MTSSTFETIQQAPQPRNQDIISPDPDSDPKLDPKQPTTLTLEHQEKNKNINDDPNNPPVLEMPGTKMDAEGLALLLIELRSKLGQEQAKTSKEEIENNLVSKEQQHKQVIVKIKDYLDALDEVSKTDLGMKILGWASAVITLVAAVVLTVATGGAAAPLLIAPIMMMIDMSLQEAGEPGMGELVGKIFEACGMDPEDAAMAGAITYAAVMLITCIIVAVATGGVGSIAVANAMTALITGSLSVAQGGLAIKKGFDQKDAMDAQAEQLDIKALMKKLQAMMENEMGRLEEIITNMDDGVMMLLKMLGNVNQSKDSILGNIGMTNQMI